MEKLLTVQALGSQKPSDMLHDLVQFCPDNEAQTRIFRYLLRQRLPTEIRIILAEDRDSTLAALAARADQLWAHSNRQPHDAAINAVLEEEGHETKAAVPALITPVVAAVDGDMAVVSRPFCGRAGRDVSPASTAAEAPADSNLNTPSKLSRQSSGLCRFHWQFGDKAYSCSSPCSWQGN